MSNKLFQPVNEDDENETVVVIYDEEDKLLHLVDNGAMSTIDMRKYLEFRKKTYDYVDPFWVRFMGDIVSGKVPLTISKYFRNDGITVYFNNRAIGMTFGLNLDTPEESEE